MIDYTGIMEKIKEILDDGLHNVSVGIETPMVGTAATTAEVRLSLTTEKNIERTIGSASPYGTILNISVFCTEFHPDGVLEATKRRDTLVGDVRALLKTNRNLGGLVGATQLGDVEFQTVSGESGFYSAANLNLRAHLIS